MTIFNKTEIYLSFWDRIRVLFGRTIHLSTDIEVTTAVEVTETAHSVWVDPFIKRKPTGFMAPAETLPAP